MPHRETIWIPRGQAMLPGVVRVNDADAKNPVTGKKVEPVLRPCERVKTRRQNITHEEMLLKQSGLVVLFTLNTGTGTFVSYKKIQYGLVYRGVK